VDRGSTKLGVGHKKLLNIEHFFFICLLHMPNYSRTPDGLL